MRYIVTNSWAQSLLDNQSNNPGETTWAPCRPIRGCDPIWKRIRWAWLVLTRRADVIQWREDIEP